MTQDVSRSPGAGLPAMDHAARRDRVRAQLASTETTTGGWFLATDPVSVRYLGGFSGSNGQVLIGPEPSDDRLVTDRRYEQRAAVECPGLAVELSRDPVEIALAAATGGVLVAEAAHLSWDAGQRVRERAAGRHVEVVPSTGLVERLRLIKDAGEVARLERACQLSVDGLGWLLAEVVAPGRSERALAVALERRFIDLGADGVAFPSIVASGPNAAVPHHAPTTRELADGDVLTLDCGAVVDGYHADLTRTVALGHLDGQLRDVHDVVRAAQLAGREAALAGVPAGDVDHAARATIEAAGWGESFVHGTGHGVGLEVHEAPAVAQDAPATLEACMALTVEPGVYLPGLGGVRIEDTIVVTADGGPRTLTDIPHELRVL